MTLKSAVLVLVLLVSAQCFGDYTLEFDWSMTSPSEEADVGYVTWNQETLLTLTNVHSSNQMQK